MVEALIVIPVFVVVNAAMLDMLHVYDAKLVTMRRTAETAWSSAASGCQGAQVAAKAQPIGAADDTSLTGLLAQAREAQQLATAPSLQAPFRQLRLAATGARAEATSEGNAVFGGGTFASDDTVLCNEKPRAIAPADEKNTVDDFYRRFVQ
jgi:hypothetical protein